MGTKTFQKNTLKPLKKTSSKHNTLLLGCPGLGPSFRSETLKVRTRSCGSRAWIDQTSPPQVSFVFCSRFGRFTHHPLRVSSFFGFVLAAFECFSFFAVFFLQFSSVFAVLFWLFWRVIVVLDGCSAFTPWILVVKHRTLESFCLKPHLQM